MSALALLARRTWGQQWRSLLMLTLTVAATVAVVLGALIGAERADSAFTRLRAEDSSSDVLAMLDDPTKVEDVVAQAGTGDGVVAVGGLQELFLRPRGSNLFPDYNLLVVAALPTKTGDPIDTPAIIAGRGLDPSAVDEITLSEGLATDLHLQVGERVELETMSDAWVDTAFTGGDPGPPDGPHVNATVVGLAVTPADFGRFSGVINVTPAFATTYEDQIRTYVGVGARLDDSHAVIVSNSGRLSLPGFGNGEVQPSWFGRSPATRDGLGTMATALRLVALAGALAGVTAVALGMLRLGRDALADHRTLAAIGWTRMEMTRLAGLILAPGVVLGVVVGAGLGVMASPLASIGLAHAVDPSRGSVVVERSFLAMVVLGSLAVLLAFVGLAATRADSERPRRSGAGWAMPPLTRMLAVPLGIRRAVFGAPEGGGRTSRGAVVATTAGVAVAVAALLVGTSIHRLADDPQLSGQGGIEQRVIDAGEVPAVYAKAMAALDGDARAADLTGTQVVFGIRAPHVGELTGLVHDIRRGDPGAAMVRGRLPAQPDEVSVGPATLDDLGLSLGDEVELSTDAGKARFRIVGVTLFPEGDFTHDSGVTMTVAGATRLQGGASTGAALFQVAFQWHSGVDQEAADRSLARQGFQVRSTAEGVRPAVVTNLDEVRTLPAVLAVLVLLLSLATIVHAVSLTTRVRRREVATMRALGLRPRQEVALVESHTLVVAGLAAVFGLVLGLALGRRVWAAIAERANVIDHPVAPWTEMAWMTGGLLAAAALLLLPLAVRSARRSPATALHAE